MANQKIMIVAVVFVGMICYGEAISCHTCTGCGNSLGILFDCATVPDFDNVYCLETRIEGSISRSCGIAQASDAIPLGCIEAAGATMCKCEGDGCNAVLMEDDSGPLPTSASNSIKCYSCQDCGSSLGSLTDCSIVPSFESVDCLETNGNGTISRSCGMKGVSEQFPLGCTDTGATTTCRCEGDGCNMVLTDGSGTDAPAPQTTTSSDKGKCVGEGCNSAATASTSAAMLLLPLVIAKMMP